MNKPLLMYRARAREAVASEDRCCHRRVLRHWSRLVGDNAHYGYHDFAFDCGGTWVGIPKQEKIPASAKIKAY